MNFANGKKVWLFLMLVALVVSGFYLWQAGQRDKKVYAGGRIVEKVSPEEIRLKVAWPQN